MDTLELIEPNKGKLDFSLIDEYINDLNEEAEKIEWLLDHLKYIEEDIISSRNDAGLQNVDLTVHSFDENHITLVGMDTDYKYMLSAFDSENGIFIVCTRISESKQLEKYDYFENKWCEIKTFTDEQLKILSNSKEFAKREVIGTYTSKFGMLTDNHLKMLLSKNKEIIELYEATHRFTYLDMLDENTVILFPCACDGTIISYKNGKYYLNAEVSFKEHFYVSTVNSKNEVLQILNNIFDKYLIEYDVVIPLSDKAFAAINVNDNDSPDEYHFNIFFTTAEREVINANEKAVLEKYINACQISEDDDVLLSN